MVCVYDNFTFMTFTLCISVSMYDIHPIYNIIQALSTCYAQTHQQIYTNTYREANLMLHACSIEVNTQTYTLNEYDRFIAAHLSYDSHSRIKCHTVRCASAEVSLKIIAFVTLYIISSFCLTFCLILSV